MRRLGAGVAIAVLVLVAAAPPASAHTGKVVATDYRSVITQGLSVPGVRIRMIEAGGRVELSNHASFDVVVLGYENEPYLRVGRAGAFQNRRSPAVYLNATRTGGTTPPPDVDAKAAPQWVRLGASPVVRWHDHRTHFMGGPALPDRVTPWTVSLVVDGGLTAVHGQLVHVPGPASWPWIAVALAFAGAVVVAVRRFGARGALLVGVALLLAADVVRVGGLSFEVVGGLHATLAQAISVGVVDVVAWVLGVAAIVRIGARHHDGHLAAGITGVLLANVGGVLEWGDLGKSQLAVVTPPLVHRLCVAGVAGLGLGVAAAVLMDAARVPVKPVAKPSVR